MSFRELRKILRFLGFDRLVSIENFRKPNFELVAEILHWLISKFDSTIEIPNVIQTEQERVTFVKTCAQVIALKASIKLNTKKIYSGDGYAVQELLKIANILYQAARIVQNMNDLNEEDETENPSFISDSTLNTKTSQIKKSRQLVSRITQQGALLSDLLNKEADIKNKRAYALSRELEIFQIEQSLKDEIVRVEREIESINFKIENVNSDESNLDIKIEKKRSELERQQKRLQTLKSIRPAFMDEYEKLEEELQTLYDSYVVKFRCLVYLDQQLEDLEKAELDQIQARKEQIRKMIEQMRQDETLKEDTKDIIDFDLGGSDEMSDEEDDEDYEDDEEDDNLFGKDLNNKANVDNKKLRSNMLNLSKLNNRKKSSRALDLIESKEKMESSDLDLEDNIDNDDDDINENNVEVNQNLSDSDSAVEREIFDIKNRTIKQNNDSDSDF